MANRAGVGEPTCQHQSDKWQKRFLHEVNRFLPSLYYDQDLFNFFFNLGEYKVGAQGCIMTMIVTVNNCIHLCQTHKLQGWSCIQLLKERAFYNLGWEFIKEKKKINQKVTTHASTQKITWTRKQGHVHEKKNIAQENTHSFRKASTKNNSFKKTRNRPRKHP